MCSKRYMKDFKVAAVRQVRGRESSVAEVVARLGTTTRSLYAWLRRYGEKAGQPLELSEHQVKNRRLKA
jgi:transposase-like protein